MPPQRGHGLALHHGGASPVAVFGVSEEPLIRGLALRLVLHCLKGRHD